MRLISAARFASSVQRAGAVSPRSPRGLRVSRIADGTLRTGLLALLLGRTLNRRKGMTLVDPRHPVIDLEGDKFQEVTV